MRASLDTNAVIHEQIRSVELENHAKDLLKIIDADIALGRMELFTDDKLKEYAVYLCGCVDFEISHWYS